MLRILLTGDGKMGQMLQALIADSPDLELAGMVGEANAADLDQPVIFGKVDVVIDFSGPGLFERLAGFVRATGAALVCGTTGFADPAGKVGPLGEFAPVVYSGNYSRGVNVIKQLVGQAAGFLGDWDVEVVETHHNQKVDAPSGTARLLIDQVQAAVNNANETTRDLQHGRQGLDTRRKSSEIGVHSLRGGSVPGEHSVYFFGPDEMVEIKHQAFSRKIFALGALQAARVLVQKPKGFYSFDDLLG